MMVKMLTNSSQSGLVATSRPSVGGHFHRGRYESVLPARRLPELGRPRGDSTSDGIWPSVDSYFCNEGRGFSHSFFLTNREHPGLGTAGLETKRPIPMEIVADLVHRFVACGTFHGFFATMTDINS